MKSASYKLFVKGLVDGNVEMQLGGTQRTIVLKTTEDLAEYHESALRTMLEAMWQKGYKQAQDDIRSALGVVR